MYSKTVRTGELTANEKEHIKEIIDIPCSNIECMYCPLNIRVTPHNNACLRDLARQIKLEN